MRYIWSLGFIVLYLITQAKDGFKVIDSNPNTVTLEYTFAGFNQQAVEINNKTYYKLDAENCVPVLNAGFPQMLRSSVSLALPKNCSPKIEILSSTVSEFFNTSIAPSKGSLKRNINPSDVAYTFGSIYQQNKFYPETVTEFNTSYNLRGQDGISLSVYPVQANSVSKTIKVYSKIIIRISYLNANGKKLNLISPEYTSQEEQEIFNERFINVNSTKLASKMAYTQLAEYGSMLIISDPSFTTQMQPFIDWKNQKGINTTMVTTVASGTTGTAVKAYIQNYYTSNPGLLYVLLVGDHQQINAYNAGVAGSETKWSDAAYGLLTGNDHYPEVMLGRFSATTASDVVTMVERTLEYEKTPLDGDWYKNVIGIASNEGYGAGDEGEADWQHIRKIGNKLLADGYSNFREFYDSTHLGTDAPGNPNPTVVSNSVNAGASLFIYCGHGSQNGCVTSNYGIANVNAATNNGKYPFSVQVACNNGTFHNGTCFCEAFLRARNNNGPTGAINSVGSTILMAWAEPMDTEDEIGDIISNQYLNNKKYTMGGIFYNSQMHMLDMYPTATGREVMETWLMFGDPSCMMRTNLPSTITVSHLGCISPGANSYSVTVSAGPGTYGCISQNNQILGANAITGVVQSVALTQTFNPGQALLLTITEFNKIPYSYLLGVCGNVTTSIGAQIGLESNIYVESLFGYELKIYHNLNSETNYKAQLFDLQGKFVLESNLNSEEGNTKINTETLVPAVYVLKIKDNSGNILKVFKVIKAE